MPTTVEEAVQIIKNNWISQEDRDWILRNPEDAMVSLHMSFGMAVRNEFGLWQNNSALRASCGKKHPY